MVDWLLRQLCSRECAAVRSSPETSGVLVTVEKGKCSVATVSAAAEPRPGEEALAARTPGYKVGSSVVNP
jgi:hypothetical protein